MQDILMGLAVYFFDPQFSCKEAVTEFDIVESLIGTLSIGLQLTVFSLFACVFACCDCPRNKHGSIKAIIGFLHTLHCFYAIPVFNPWYIILRFFPSREWHSIGCTSLFRHGTVPVIL